MMNNLEKDALRLMAKEAFNILDDIKTNGTFFTIKNGEDKVCINQSTYNNLLHLLRLIERAHCVQKLDWFRYGMIPDFSVGPILKDFE